jgi:hypothetical protein
LVTFPKGCRGFADARIYVRAEDITMADRAAETLAEQVLENVTYNGEAVAFELTLERWPERRDVTISALVDVDGDGEISRGDYMNKVSCPARVGETNVIPVEMV